MKVEVSKANQPNWKEITVASRVPKGLEKLQEIARNLWFVWTDEAQDLFNDIDKTLWESTNYNPVLMLEKLNYEKMEEIVKDKAYMSKLEEVYADFRRYLDVKPDPEKPTVAYFSMEYGLTQILKIYSGGLGVLAGDYLKEASDSNIDMVAVGFLYRYGYFTQTLSMDGDQLAVYDPHNFNQLPLEQVKDDTGAQMIIEVPFSDRIVYANLWRVAVGRISLYLLDTDTPLNSEFDRSITYQLYGGDWENRLKQEYLLGIGGIVTLNRLGIAKQVYHCNEGHAALINAERLANYVAKGLSFNEAFEVVKSTSLYTVHTPVPAGHDYFDEGLFQKYMNKYPAKLGISWDEFIGLGRQNPEDKGEKFSMSTFACNTCQEVNGVSWLHGKVSQEMFQHIWKGYFPEESHVNYVTNGVHLPTWTSTSWKRLYDRAFGQEYIYDQSNMSYWEKIYQVDDEDIWRTRTELKKKLIEHIKVQFQEQWMKNQGDPSRIVSVVEGINPNALIIGFGRRFATYKRAHLLFTDLDRLAKIVNNAQCPVQFLYTGKAHPADGAGQGLIKRIVEISRMPQFLGKIIFLENYDMRLAKRLVSGVDIWLNTPTRPLEASGTSGEKAQMNGVLNFSVLDGWWLEGYVKGAGWAITEKRTFENNAHQDQLDAATIYSMLENEIVPMYFAKNSRGYSPEWIQTIKNSIAKITPRYTMKRMLDDYIEKFYNKLASRGNLMKENNFSKAKEMSAWKQKITGLWDNIEVTSLSIPEKMVSAPAVGEDYEISAVIDTKDASENGIGLELVVTYQDAQNNTRIYEVEELKLENVSGSKLSFKVNYRLNTGGAYKFGIRMYPKNADLPYRQNFCFVRWI
jgi:starch phosphorylase